MKQRWYKIELLSPLVFTARNVTQGDYSCLDYIPGQSLLGAAARAYDDFSQAESWSVFHSGQVRFGDAFLLTGDGLPAFPMPYSLHEVKRQQASELSNQAVGSGQKDQQYEQMRSGHLQLDVKAFEAKKQSVPTSSSLKIAVDSNTGSARDGHLYGIEAINAGQTYVCSIMADDGISDALLDRVEQVFVGHQRLGRSKNTEFGLVNISPLPDFQARWQPVSQSAEVKDEVVVYLTGHLALDDESGQPRLLPDASDFGLPKGWRLELSRSFMRYHFLDRFNGHRVGFDIQREVVQRGSVLVFSGSALSERALADVKKAAGQGAGLHRQEGFGQYLLNPSWLLQSTISLVKNEQAVLVEQVELPDAVLGEFLKSRLPVLSKEQHDRLHALAKKIAGKCTQAYDVDKWPSESQWSRARAWAKSAALTKDSFLDLMGGTQRKMSRGWENIYEHGQSLGEYFVETAASGLENEAQKRVFLSELAHLVRGHLVHHKKAGQQNQQNKEVAR